MFTYGDIVFVREDAPEEFRPGAEAWIVGVFDDREKYKMDWLPPGTVYTIEYEGGDAIDIVEDMLQAAPGTGE